MEKEIIHTFLYCDNTFDEGLSIQSAHRLIEGAQKALDLHKKTEKEIFDRRRSRAENLNKFDRIFKFGSNKEWELGTLEILD